MANFNNIKQFTLDKEGGLSNDKRDTASSYPSPYTYNGQTGWHTNKGITYKTFEEASKRYGFENNANNFLTMPDAIWTQIAKGSYWDKMNLDTLKSDGVAFQLFSWNWGAGTKWYPLLQKYFSSKGISWDGKSATVSIAANNLIDKQGERQTIKDLESLQISYYESLNQPVFIKGWVRRIKETTQIAYSRVIEFAKRNEANIVNYGMLGAGIIILTGITYLYYKRRGK